jgi:uncharacterized protein YbaR (Trm112 family)
MFAIEPLSQGDPANFQLLLFRLAGTQSRVSLFAAPFCRAKGNVMSTKLACSVVPTMEICPNCKSKMTIREVTPILLADGFEHVTYRCKSCRSEMKRTFKRCSGAWELVTPPSFLALRPEANKKTATEANQNQGLA